MSGSDLLTIVLLVFCGLLALVVYFLPTIIALWRKHHYKWVIFAINLFVGVTGVGYLVALIWAAWPRQTAVFDVIA
ncbi:MAG: superinfection immunity protein, partial [Verrucomicrobiota bacterium]